jgi:hypothetical protein
MKTFRSLKWFGLAWGLSFGLMAGDTIAAPSDSGWVTLFDGKTFQGWHGDTSKTWRLENGVIVGGSLLENVPNNEFLKSDRPYTNFVLQLKAKLQGTKGFVNGGVQVRSQPMKDPAHEMIGYQADIGAGYWGALYDESRRRKMLVQPNPEDVAKALKPKDWNHYEIRCEGRRIRIVLNGVAMIDYTEPDQKIPQFGLIGLQIHGGAIAEIRYKDIRIRELP